ncbi:MULTISPECIES: adenylyl-sulfate kinase [unclassified Caballeronia]|jgi:adenylylsulfate kinase|uniref:adenylyl-sulfate kinase n=1 Tax=unclassified Caballeronia TaxID=2646786 RepID=UPI003ECE9CE9
MDLSADKPPHVHPHAFAVGAKDRAELLQQTPGIVWFTGLPAAGKSTLAGALEVALHNDGKHSFLLDGDTVRTGLCRDLGFSDEHRHENIRRLSEVSRLMADAGLLVLVCAVSPFAADRQLARVVAGPHRFVEVHVHAPIAVAESRDPKGLYKLARQGAIKNFTGIDSPYEEPMTPDVRIDTTQCSVADAMALIIHRLSGS